MSGTIKLLIIDDDDVDRLHIRRSLKKSGLNFDLSECDDLHSIDAALAQTSYDCIFLDYLLPGENGLSLLRKIREKGLNTPVVIITSQGSEQIAVELMKAGASDYIIKDQINETSLRQIITTIVRTSAAELEKENALHKLKISEAKLAEAQRVAKIGSWELDTNTNEFYWSEQMYAIFERSKTDFVPNLTNYTSLLQAHDQPACQEALTNLLAGKPINIDISVEVPSGIKAVNIQGYTISNLNQGSGVKIFGTAQDITERKKTEHELLDARQIAENSLNVKQLFLANMSHEIRTPMNAVIGFTQLLYETPLSAEQKGFVDAIRFSGENLLVIINDILDLSKIQSGKMQFESIRFNLNELLQSVITGLKCKAELKGLKVMLETPEGSPLHVAGDPVRVNQILTNLINNAIKFTEKGHVRIHIRAIESSSNQILVEFNVEDTGIGIPPDKQAYIFESFVQGSNATSRKYGGTGLGLTIVKNLIELLQGTISLNSIPGVGSTFTVVLPFEGAEHEVNNSQPANEVQIASLNELHKASILVVEDNHVNQLLVKRVLEKTGSHVDIASNGIECIDRLKTGHYDVVLMDLQMPEMDGYTATKYIRSNLPPPLCQIPIIAMTAHALTSEVDKCMAIGMNDYLSKPFKQEVLFSKIAKFINQDPLYHHSKKAG